MRTSIQAERTALLALLLAFVPAHILASGRTELPTGPYALTNLVLIDGTGAEPLQNAVVLVRDGVIEAVGSAGEIDVPPTHRKVPLRGAFVLPGFINAHVHRAYDASTLSRWLRAGVTTVRDLGPLEVFPFTEVRDRLNADPRNARIISATPLISPTGGYGGWHVDDTEEAREAVRYFVDAVVDVVKVAVEDNLQGRTWRLIGAEEIAAIVEEAHAAGRNVSAHVTHVRNLSLAVDAGVDDLAHMVVEPLPLLTARAIAAKGIVWVPTLELWRGMSAMHGLVWDQIAVANTGLFFREGGRIALGTDFSGYITAFDRDFPMTEVGLLRQAGLQPMDIIVAGTRNAADVCGRLHDLGTLEPGKIADMIVVRGDPLHDLSVLERPVMVIKSGTRVRAARS